VTNLTCVVRSVDHYLISFTLVRPGASSVRISNYPWTGYPYVGQWTYNGVHYNTDTYFGPQCGLLN